MKIDKDNWRDVDINIDSLWIIGPRAKGGKRENNYHGNFVPQVPDHIFFISSISSALLIIAFY